MGEAGKGIKLYELMAVRGVDKRYIEPLGGGIHLCLLESVGRGVVFCLSL